MVINIRFLIYITLILLFLPSFCFIIGQQFIPVYIPSILLVFFLLSIFYYKQLLNNALYFYQKTPFKYLVIFFIWAVITIIFSLLFGRFFIGGFITSTLGGLICSVMLPFLFTLFIVPKYLSYNNLIKFIYLICWLVFLLGILDFIIFYFDIPVLKDIITIFSNKRLLTDAIEVTRGFVGTLPRARSIFDEPSYLGYFIFVVSPIVYELSLNKFKIFKNNYFNVLIKRTIIPFMWVSLVFTQSPIFLVFNIIFSCFYFLIVRKGHKKVIRYLLPLLLVLVCSYLLISLIIVKVDISKTYLNRIILVIQNIKSFEDFIMVEPSLGTRIIIMINAIYIGLKNIFWGVGYGNMSYLMAAQLSQSVIPLTEELQRFVFFDRTTPASTIFIKIFSETGIFGVILFYSFLYSLYRKINILKNKLVFVDVPLINGLQLFIITYFFSSFYDSNLNQPYIYIILGLIISKVYKKKYNV